MPHGPILSHRYSQSQGKKRCSKFNACPVACFTLLGLRFCHSIVALLAHQDESTGHAVGRGPQDVASMCQKATLILNSTVYSYFMLFLVSEPWLEIGTPLFSSVNIPLGSMWYLSA